MSDSSTAGTVLTEDQSRSLPLLLNMIIPPDPDQNLPGAGDLNFLDYVTAFDAGRIEAIRVELDTLNHEARNRYQRPFADLQPGDRGTLVDRLRSESALFARNIVVQTIACYYQDDQVMEALGMEARPPFPKGNNVKSGDLSLLDPVRQRTRIFRDA